MADLIVGHISWSIHESECVFERERTRTCGDLHKSSGNESRVLIDIMLLAQVEKISDRKSKWQ